MSTTWRATCSGLLLLTPLLLTACGADEDPAPRSAATSSSAEATGVYGQPTDPDAGEPDEVATDAPQSQSPSSGSPAASAPAAPASAVRVSPQLTYFGWNADAGAVEAGGIVPAIVESGGRCTLTMSQGGQEVDTSAEGVDNVTSTSCSEMVVPGDRLSPGAWRTVLTYESATARGASEPVEIQVP